MLSFDEKNNVPLVKTYPITPARVGDLKLPRHSSLLGSARISFFSVWDRAGAPTHFRLKSYF